MLPFEPETLEQLQARYPQALEHIYTSEQIQGPEAERPSLKREHVFDSLDGLRLIVNRCRWPGHTVLQFSCSVMNDTPLFQHFSRLMGIRSNAEQMTEYCEIGRAWFMRVSDDHREPNEFTITPGKGVPNWFIFED